MAKNTVFDPFEYLMEDHKKVAAVFDTLKDTTENAVKTRTANFAKLNEMLTLHADVEEAELYPRLTVKDETHSDTMEAIEEHVLVRQELADLEAMDVTSDEWTAKCTVLREMVEHHVEEEESELFPEARKVIGKEGVEELAAAMKAFLGDKAPTFSKID